MFVMELPRFGRDTTLSFGGIDQFATMVSDNMGVCEWKLSFPVPYSGQKLILPTYGSLNRYYFLTVHCIL